MENSKLTGLFGVAPAQGYNCKTHGEGVPIIAFGQETSKAGFCAVCIHEKLLELGLEWIEREPETADSTEKTRQSNEK